MDESNISLLVEAKTEYTNQLINLLHKPIYDGIKSVYEESIDFCKKIGANVSGLSCLNSESGIL